LFTGRLSRDSRGGQAGKKGEQGPKNRNKTVRRRTTKGPSKSFFTHAFGTANRPTKAVELVRALSANGYPTRVFAGNVPQESG
jgi:hypothetical protein